MYKVYLVDDESYVIRELQILIDWQSFGYEIVGWAYDPAAAEREIAEMQPDVVILDVNMQGMSGLSLAERLRRAGVRAVICFLSAYDKFDYAVRAIDLGAKAYLTKPVQEERLKELLLRMKEELDGAEREGAPQDGRAPQEEPPEVRSDVVRDMLEHIERNYKDRISLTDYAEKYHYTVVYLSRLFKNSTGCSFIDYVVRYRMNKAAALIAAGEVSLKEAGWAVGYADYYQFSKIFKKYMGCSPREYRANNVKKSQAKKGK